MCHHYLLRLPEGPALTGIVPARRNRRTSGRAWLVLAVAQSEHVAVAT
jgi:hypothetical protein